MLYIKNIFLIQFSEVRPWRFVFENRARIAQEISAPNVIFMLYLNITFSRAGFDDIFHMEYTENLK